MDVPDHTSCRALSRHSLIDLFAEAPPRYYLVPPPFSSSAGERKIMNHFVVNIPSSYTLRLGAFAGNTPDSLVAANTSGRAKNAHAFARVEDVTLCPSQD